MKRPTQITYNGHMYRLAEEVKAPDVPPETILETAANPTENAAASPAPDASESDRKTLELLLTNVVAHARALADGMDSFMGALGNRTQADKVLAEGKDHLDGVLEDFKLLSSKYSGYARRHLSE